MTEILGRGQLVAVELKVRKAKNPFLEISYYRRTVKVASFLIFIMTFFLIVLLYRLISSLFLVLEHALLLYQENKIHGNRGERVGVTRSAETNRLTIRFKWIMFQLLISSLIILVPRPCVCQTLNESSDQIWAVGPNRWTAEEEYRFGKWVDENITEDFFIRYRTPTDCADAVYAIRWFFARIALLPAAATTKVGKLIGHWST